MSRITGDVLKQWNNNKKERKNEKLKKKNRKLKKVLIIIALLVMNGLGVINAVYASTPINSAHVYAIGDCGQLLKYKGVIVVTDYVQYTAHGINYPAYCLDKTKIGAQVKPYDVSIQEAIKDVGLWKVIINGYPYKSIQELGVANKEEAFTATKQAVYCYIHENKPEDYEGIGEAGNRTLRALHKIVKDAQNEKGTKISNTLEIKPSNVEWKQDELNPQYVSKTFSISAGAHIKNFNITVIKENAQDIGGIKLTNIQNVEKSEFAPNEQFKVLVPIKNMTEEATLKLTVESQIQTKPILYGVAPNSQNQDYALTAATYEDGRGEKRDAYPKNETKIIIVKQDEKTKQKLEGVEFELLDENKKVVYADLKTNKEGKIQINHIIPGKYYLKETRTKEGYEKYEELIDLEIALQEEYTVTVNNNPEEKPKVEIDKKTKNKEVSSANVKKVKQKEEEKEEEIPNIIKREKLPVTGK